VSDHSLPLAERFDENYWSSASHYRRYEGFWAAQQELSRWFSGLVELIGPYLPRPPARVVDAGCGHGVVVEALRARGYDALGFDPSRFMIEQAQASSPASRHAFAEGTIDNIPFAGDFDAMMCFEVLEHIDDPVDALHALRARLRQEGTLIFSTPNLEPRSLWKDPRTSDPTHVSVHGRAWWDGAVQAAGFRIVRSTTFAPVPLTWRVHPRLGRWQTLGGRLGPQVLVVADKG
jgi:SAM-dependent methyltransferase